MNHELLRAIESGELTEDQVQELIAFEAAEIGLTYDQAVALGRARSLPGNAMGSDIQMLLGLIAEDAT